MLPITILVCVRMCNYCACVYYIIYCTSKNKTTPLINYWFTEGIDLERRELYYWATPHPARLLVTTTCQLKRGTHWLCSTVLRGLRCGRTVCDRFTVYTHCKPTIALSAAHTPFGICNALALLLFLLLLRVIHHS